MNKIKLWFAVLAIAITLPGCTGTATQSAQQSATVMVLPVTTTSDEAREQFMSGGSPVQS